MASLRDIFFGALDEKTELTERFGGACILAANEIKGEDPGVEHHAERLEWASPIVDPDSDTTTRKEVVLRKGAQIKQRAFGFDPELGDKLNGLSDEEIKKITADQINRIVTGK